MDSRDLGAPVESLWKIRWMIEAARRDRAGFGAATERAKLSSFIARWLPGLRLSCESAPGFACVGVAGRIMAMCVLAALGVRRAAPL